MTENTLPGVDGIEEALEGATSPTQGLAAAWLHAPRQEIRDYIDNKTLEILVVDMPKLQQCVFQGPTADRADTPTVEKAYMQAVAEINAQAPDVLADVTATVNDAAEEIARAIDSAVDRVLLEDKTLNRMAIMDITTLHAKLVKALADLAITPDQQAELDAHELASSA